MKAIEDAIKENKRVLFILATTCVNFADVKKKSMCFQGMQITNLDCDYIVTHWWLVKPQVNFSINLGEMLIDDAKKRKLKLTLQAYPSKKCKKEIPVRYNWGCSFCKWDVFSLRIR